MSIPQVNVRNVALDGAIVPQCDGTFAVVCQLSGMSEVDACAVSEWLQYLIQIHMIDTSTSTSRH